MVIQMELLDLFLDLFSNFIYEKNDDLIEKDNIFSAIARNKRSYYVDPKIKRKIRLTQPPYF